MAGAKHEHVRGTMGHAPRKRKILLLLPLLVLLRLIMIIVEVMGKILFRI